MKEGIVIGGIYQHYKGMHYLVKDVARHSETLEYFVVYECLYENNAGKIWIRPLEMFSENIILNGQEVPRFKYLLDAKL
jgi:hypothetical protein